MHVRRRAIPLCLALFAVLGGLGASCSDRTRGAQGTAAGGSQPLPEHPPAATSRVLPKPDARLLLVTDLKGYLAPCGCTSRPLGGIDRMAAKVEELRKDGVPTAIALAGETLFDGVTHDGISPEAARNQEVWKAETLVDVWNSVGAAAATQGRYDATYGTDVATALGAAAKFPLLHGGKTEAAPLGNTRVVFAGFVDGDAAVFPASMEGAPALGIALVNGSRRYARQLAKAPGVTFVINGGLDAATASPPAAVENAFVLNGGRQGQGLLVVDLYLRGGGTFTDWSAWTLDETRQHLWDRIRELTARLAEWDRDPKMRGTPEVAAQRAKLTDLQGELARTQLPEKVAGNAFAARWVELPPEAAVDSAISAKLRAYDKRVNESNRTTLANITPRPAAPEQATYVGSEACASCHQSDFAAWKNTLHSHAYETLVTRDKQYNLSCVGCHVVGYMKPGGATVTHNGNGKLVDVGCENCHGPGSKHVETPKLPGLLVVDTPESTCRGCHNPEHSDKFDFRVYRSLIVVPGHGLPLGKQGSP